MILDRNIKYKYKTEYWPVATFSCFAGASGATVDAVDGRSLTELTNDLGIVGLKQPTEGDIVRHLLPTPSHWDTGNDLFVRCIWTEEGTSSSEITYTITYNELSFGDIPVAGSTALDTVLVADRHCGNANGINATKWGKINADSISADYLVLNVEMTTESAGSMQAVLLGIEWAYLPKLTDGAQHKLTTDPTDA